MTQSSTSVIMASPSIPESPSGDDSASSASNSVSSLIPPRKKVLCNYQWFFTIFLSFKLMFAADVAR